MQPKPAKIASLNKAPSSLKKPAPSSLKKNDPKSAGPTSTDKKVFDDIIKSREAEIRLVQDGLQNLNSTYLLKMLLAFSS